MMHASFTPPLMLVRGCLIAIFASSLAGGLYAEETHPQAGWVEQVSPYASPEAQPGGELVVYSGPYPKSLNYYLDTSVQSADIFGALFESLLDLNSETLAFEPALASAWTISEDKLSYTFTLDPEARWSDGQPITAQDVAWTVQAILDPKHLTGPHKIDLERFDVPEVIGDREIRFRAREAHWKNLIALAGFQILPRHLLATQDFNAVHFEFPVVSGPYALGELKEGFSCRLDRRADSWRRGRPRSQGVGNFDRVVHRFISERDNAFELFLKGGLDLYPVYTAHQWVNQTSGDRFERNWIVKQRVQNYNPIGFQGFAMNLRRPPFDDVRVRRAMALLLDREKMNRTLMYDQYFLHRSYYEDLYDPEHPCALPVVPFNVEQARALLAEAGWTVNPENGLLAREGKPFSFSFLTRDASSDKFLVIYQEVLRDVGITMNLVQKDWAAWMKDMDEFNFDMTWAAWGGGLWRDPESMWHSREADRPASQNITGFKDPGVDALIETQRTEFDARKRNEILRAIDARLVEGAPYVLLWNLNYTRLLFWNKFGMPSTVLGRYGDERAAYGLWWADPDAEADLQAAREAVLPLPRRPASVQFDDVYRR